MAQNETRGVWDREMKLLDSQHLIERHIADRLERALSDGSGAPVLSEVFDQLCDYVVLHFTAEEKIMVEAGYPGVSFHQAHHDHMRQRLFDLERRFREGDPAAAEETLQLLRTWTREHISTADRELVQYLSQPDESGTEKSATANQ